MSRLALTERAGARSRVAAGGPHRAVCAKGVRRVANWHTGPMADEQTRGPQLPVGTTVIDPRGRVGQIATWLGSDRYEVRYPDDLVADWMGNSLHLQKHSQRDLLALLQPRDGIALVERGLILKTVTGSRIFGLDTETSDTDVRGVFVCPVEEYLDLRWQLDPVQGVRPNNEEHFWEVGRLVWLALKADPNTLECLWSPEVLYMSPEGEQLLAARSGFLSKHAFVTYGGYVLSQLRRLRADLRQGEPNWKHAMHLARLLLAGTALLREGQMTVDVGPMRERLLAVKHGKMAWEEYEAWRLALQAEFDSALDKSPLPERPDVESVLSLVRALRASDVTGRRARAHSRARPAPEVDTRVTDAAVSLGERTIFATVSGAHLYGFASADSDWDLRACHALAVERFAGLALMGLTRLACSAVRASSSSTSSRPRWASSPRCCSNATATFWSRFCRRSSSSPDRTTRSSQLWPDDVPPCTMPTTTWVFSQARSGRLSGRAPSRRSSTAYAWR